MRGGPWSTGAAATARWLALAAAYTASSSSSSSGDSDSKFKQWYATQFPANQSHLTGLPSAAMHTLLNTLNGNRSADTQVALPCDGAPSVQTRAGEGAVTNGKCPPLLTSWGTSCTCLPVYVAAGWTTTWEFRVKKKQSQTTVPSAEPTDELEIDAIETLVVPPNLEHLYVTW